MLGAWVTPSPESLKKGDKERRDKFTAVALERLLVVCSSGIHDARGDAFMAEVAVRIADAVIAELDK